MVKPILYASDIHGDVELAEAIGKLTHEFDTNVVLAGDIGDSSENVDLQKKAVKKQQEIVQGVENGEETEEEAKKKMEQIGKEVKEADKQSAEKEGETYKKLDEIFKKYKNEVVGVRGNHDRKDLMDEHLGSLKRLEGKLQNISGVPHYGISYSSMDFFNIKKEEEAYKPSVDEEEMKYLRENADNIKVAVMHEGAHKNLQAEKTQLNEELTDLLSDNNISIACGHAHSPHFESENDRYLMRTSCAGEGGEKAVYVTLLSSSQYEVHKIDPEMIKKVHGQKQQQEQGYRKAA